MRTNFYQMTLPGYCGMHRPNTSKRKRIGRCRINIIYRAIVLIGICCCIKRSSSFSTQHPSRWTVDRRRRTNPSIVLRWRISTLHQSSKGVSSSSDNRQVEKAPIKGKLAKKPSTKNEGKSKYKKGGNGKGLRYHSSPRQNRGRRRNQDPDMRVCQSIEELTQLAYEHISTMSPRGMSAYWTLVSKLLRNRSSTSNSGQIQLQIDELTGKTLRSIERYNPRNMSTIAISLAKIINKVQKRRTLHYGSTEQILQDILIGNDSKIKESIFLEIASASVPILHEFNARDLSNLIYAYGLVEYIITEDEITMFDIFAQAAIPNLHTFNGQDLSNMLWSYANVGVSNSQLFEQARDAIVGRLDNLHNFKPQALSNIIWAYATLDEQHPKLFKKIAEHIVTLDNLDRYDSQALSNIVWAYATAEESHPELFKKVADHIVRLDSLRQFNEQALSNIVWAYATARESHPQLFKKVADHIVSLDTLRTFNGQALSNTVWAYATAGESHPQLFKKLADEAIKRQHEFIPQDTANFLWAFATNGQVDEHLFSSLVPSVKANLDKCNEQELINVAWAYSVANVDAPSVFNNEFINACSREENGFILEVLLQLHQWQLWQEELKSDVSLPPSLKKKCNEAFISVKPSSSKTHDDVVSILSSMGLQPQEEVLLNSGYMIDAIVEVNGKQVAVEVDGPSHFIGRSRELAGSTILKHRQVASVDGMKVNSVPYWEWDNLENDSKKKEQYLRDFLGI